MWLKRLEAARLPYGSVNNVAEVLSHPQMIARHMIREINSPVGRIPVMATPLHLSDSPQRLDPVPDLGGDNEAILSELGYTNSEIAAFKRDNVI